ncbi:MAG: adenosylhomocysteinase [Candidatus Omnitrophica bacterium CG11_big_fil_rev_8_21_14_0_20_64_10]|nr:MAG: adenosylhomocysteinase [Candidatus Omnitrophica bacterium CG11_big_fil_rev_8_21_14_0_20_64_10]
MKSDITNPKLAAAGQARVDWAGRFMPVLAQIRERFEKERPLKGIRIAACLHVTTETAQLMRTLKAGGADVALCASNPLSTQDDTAAALAAAGFSVHARRGEDNKTYYKHIDSVLDMKPQVTMDDGADLVSRLHTERRDLVPGVLGSTEETTTGVIRLKALEQQKKLLFPVIAVNDSQTKFMFDNRYGTGQSTLDGILRATNILIAGSVVVVCGYGWCGRGVAMRAKGFGAHVIVCEVEPVRALEAAMDGFEVMPIAQAAAKGDLFVSVTGDAKVISEAAFKRMKDGAIVANSGHFNVEVDLEALKKLSKNGGRTIKPEVEEFELRSGRRVLVLAGGRLVNLSCAEGHPAEVMDMSFANQALAAEWLAKSGKTLAPKVHRLPEKFDRQIAALKLKAKGIQIDRLTAEQKHYLSSWEAGT